MDFVTRRMYENKTCC